MSLIYRYALVTSAQPEDPLHYSIIGARVHYYSEKMRVKMPRTVSATPVEEALTIDYVLNQLKHDGLISDVFHNQAG